MAGPRAPHRVESVSRGEPARATDAQGLLLAGDVGGTKTRLGLFECATQRPRQLAARTYSTRHFERFEQILDRFQQDIGRSGPVQAAAIGVAGPVTGDTARLTNVDLTIAADEIAARFSASRVALLNDLEAMAYGTTALDAHEVVELQQGEPRPDGHAAVIAAGTGLGQAYLHRLDGRLRPAASEGGHADFAARTDREWQLVRALRTQYGRAEVEHVLCGQGLLNLHRFTHDNGPCSATGALDDAEAAARVSQSAMTGACGACVEALGLFVEAYGSEAGNLALRAVATGGLFVGGGIAPRILPALQDGRFLAAFRAKGAMSALVARVPVRVILLAEVGLLGAAVAAQALAERQAGDASSTPGR